MENKLDTNEIEESLRICEELFQNNPDFNRRAPRPVEALELAKNVTAPVVEPEPAVEPVPVTKPVSEEKTESAKPVVSQAPEPVKPPVVEKEPKPSVEPVSVTKPVSKEKKETQPNDSEPDSKKEKSKPNIKKKFDCVWHLRCDCYCDRTDHYQFCRQSYQSGGKFHGIYAGKR